MDPVKTTPDPASGNAPAWTVKAADEINVIFSGIMAISTLDKMAVIIAKHAPASPPATAQDNAELVELGSLKQALRCAQEREAIDHAFFIATMDAVGMKGEVGSVYTLQKQIVAKITDAIRALERAHSNPAKDTL
jgi:hypothetical protein